jgi:hypothetical protein
METKTLKRSAAFSRGFDAGNYGNAYESQSWATWAKSRKIASKSTAYQHGALLGFYSSYELHEIGNEIRRDDVEYLRKLYGEEI